MNEEANKFIKSLIGIRDYWLSLNESREDTIDGFIYSMLVMMDGDSGINDFVSYTLIRDKIEARYTYDEDKPEAVVNEDVCLHELYYGLLAESEGE